MTELSEDEEQSLDEALSTLDDLYEATLQPDGGFCSEQMEAIAKLAEEAMGCVLSVLDPEMFDAVQRDCPGKKLGREARAVRTLTLLPETPQKLAGLGAALETADLLRRGLGLEAPAAHHEGTTPGTSGTTRLWTRTAKSLHSAKVAHPSAATKEGHSKERHQRCSRRGPIALDVSNGRLSDQQESASHLAGIAMSDHQEQLHEELEQIRVALDQMAFEARQSASEAPGPSPRAPSTGALPTDRSIEVIVEIEAKAVTVERLFLVSERQDWTFGETLEYALDALELAMAKTATGGIPNDLLRPRSLRR